MLNKKGWGGIAMCAVLLLVLAGWAGWSVGRRRLRVEAIKAGHARHVITDEYGHTEFQWLLQGDK
jgi:hypothetical protein